MRTHTYTPLLPGTSAALTANASTATGSAWARELNCTLPCAVSTEGVDTTLRHSPFELKYRCDVRCVCMDPRGGLFEHYVTLLCLCVCVCERKRRAHLRMGSSEVVTLRNARLVFCRDVSALAVMRSYAWTKGQQTLT